jgi:hypothetical protein
MICPSGGHPPPGLSAARVLAARRAYLVFYYLLVIFFFNIVPLIVEFTSSTMWTNRLSLQDFIFTAPQACISWVEVSSTIRATLNGYWIVIRRLLRGHNDMPIAAPGLAARRA